jgi:hypothetical protein
MNISNLDDDNLYPAEDLDDSIANLNDLFLFFSTVDKVDFFINVCVFVVGLLEI